jgi:hypothetical protein
MVLRKFDFKLAIKPEDVGIYTGATIHTRNGLMMHVTQRVHDNELKLPVLMDTKEVDIPVDVKV